jgi:putative tricarboxylic transport membrane protein
MSEIVAAIFIIPHLLMMIVGVAVGIIIGALPGLNVIFAIAVLLPFTFGLESLSGMYLLLGAYCGATYGGSISAILINTPGTPAAAATLFDGYPLSQKGRSGDALNAALFGSTFGGIVSAAALLFFAPKLATVALKIASPEYFALCVFGLTAVIGVSGDNILKGIIMAIIGLFLSTVGIDASQGVQRFMFGNMQLLAGFKPAIIMLGMFAMSEVLFKSNEIVETQRKKTIDAFQKATIKISYMLKYWKTLLKSSLIGVIIGAIPGTGGAIAAMFAYNEAHRSSKTPQKFGQGSIEGVLAPETANNAVTGATLIPLLTLGIPGDAAVAVLLGALTMQGITPGTALFSSGSTWVYAIMGGLFLVNIFMFLEGVFFIRGFANITRVPLSMLLPCIMVLCTVGSFAISNSTFDVTIMAVAGLFGYIMKKRDFPIPPLTISLVLGELTEVNLRRSLILSENGVLIFITRPISALIIAISLLTLAYPFIKAFFDKRKAAKRSLPAQG